MSKEIKKVKNAPKPEKREPPKYIIWVIHAPPATRFFQRADGNFELYFESSRMHEMIDWAYNNAGHFEGLAGAYGIDVEAQEKAAQEKKPQGQVSQQQTQNTKQAAQQAAQQKKGGIPDVKVIVQQAIASTAKTMNRRKRRGVPNISQDPGMAIAMRQAQQLDQANGVDRKAREEEADRLAAQDTAPTPEEQEGVEEQDETELATSPSNVPPQPPPQEEEEEGGEEEGEEPEQG